MTASNRSNRIGKENNPYSLTGIGVSPDFSQKAISLYKEKLFGLSGFCRLVMYDLFEYIDFESGTIAIDSLDILARTDFHVDSLRGRKKEDVTGDTIRNALRSIKKAKPDHFIFSTVNQRIVIEMPFIRELYESIYNETPEPAAVLSTDLAAAQTQAPIDDQRDFDPLLSEELDSKLAAASLDAPINAYAKIKPNKPNNNNNEKQIVGELPGEIKNTIPDNFQPSQAMIDNALRLGLPKVIDPSELNKFIIFNKASGSRWANWDYVYLNWLIRDVEREQEKAASKPQPSKQNPVYSRRDINERNHHAVKPGKPTVEDAMYANRDAVAPWECIQYEPTGNVITTDDFMVVG